jgi:4-aminobutyrate aminotransferase/(S)-3-amino-2-methylpropionate transaminase
MADLDVKILIDKYRKYMIALPVEELFILKGNGAQVEDIEGRTYIDCTSGPGVLNVGHCHPEVTRAIREQVGKLTQCVANAFNVPMIQLAEKLASIAPSGLTKTFYANSGAEAVEGAVKLAVKYAIQAGKSSAGIICLEHGFHGRLGLSLSITSQTDRKRGFMQYASFPFVTRLPAPYCYRCPVGLRYPECNIACADSLERIFDTHRDPEDTAALVMEPLLAVGGVILPPPEYIPRVFEICRRNNILVIFDEVFTGFGRTGKMFACEHSGEVPDIITMAKAVGGGLPLGAFIASERVAEAFKAGDHYTTFGGNNAASCVAGLVAIEVIERERLVENAAELGSLMLQELRDRLGRLPWVGEVRGQGLLIGLEVVRSQAGRKPAAELATQLSDHLKGRGVLVSVCGIKKNVIRLTPPLNLTREQSFRVLEALSEAAGEI